MRRSPFPNRPTSQPRGGSRGRGSGRVRRGELRPRGLKRGNGTVRLRAGFVVIAMVLSAYGGRLVQLQAFDPNSYATMAAAEDTVSVVLPANRGAILDRTGKPLADSADGLMVVADPAVAYKNAAPLATFLSQKLGVDYFTILPRLQDSTSQFAYIARQVPAAKATAVVDRATAKGWKGLSTARDPRREYPAGDVAANLVGFLGTPLDDGQAKPLAGFELAYNKLLAGKDGRATYTQSGGTQIPLGRATTVPPQNGHDLHTTIDEDLQFYAQRVLQQTVDGARADSGTAVVMDSRTGEILADADYPTYNAAHPLDYPKADLGARSVSDVYEPGSVEKVLTLSSLIDAGKVTDKTRLKVPGELPRDGTVIHDWFPHGLLKLTLAGVLAKSSNIGTVLAADRFEPGQLLGYLAKFGLGPRTNAGAYGESPGIVPPRSLFNHQTQDRVAFGQSISVNAIQMAAAVNTIANHGVRVSPSFIQGSARMDDGTLVGTDHTTRTRVVSRQAAHETMLMMERVIDPDAGVAPLAAVPGYRVAGKTGTAQRANSACGCYDGTFTVSFAGFAPADKPRFTVYVVVQNPRNGGGGGSVGGPAFSKIMGFALRHYEVPPTGTQPSKLPVEW